MVVSPDLQSPAEVVPCPCTRWTVAHVGSAVGLLAGAAPIRATHTPRPELKAIASVLSKPLQIVVCVLHPVVLNQSRQTMCECKLHAAELAIHFLCAQVGHQHRAADGEVPCRC